MNRITNTHTGVDVPMCDLHWHDFLRDRTYLSEGYARRVLYAYVYSGETNATKCIPCESR
jgi:hypothetical protein